MLLDIKKIREMDIVTKIKMKFKKPKVVELLEVIDDKCVGCGACVTKCKRNVFEMDQRERVARVAHLNDCVGCGKCVKIMCNFEAIKLVLAE